MDYLESCQLQANGLTTYHWEKIPEVEQEANTQNPEARENAGATAELPVKKAKPFMGEEGLMPDVLDQKIWVKIKEDVEKRFKCNHMLSDYLDDFHQVPVHTVQLQRNLSSLKRSANTSSRLQRSMVVTSGGQ